MMKLLIDCDPGVDDSIAILFALNRPEVEIVGISTSVGNVTAAQGAENALRLLKLAGKEGQIPVCVGAEQPLAGNVDGFPDFIHGKNGLGNVELPVSSQKPVDMDVCDFIYKAACQYEGELVLISLGRMTNLALTIEKYPDFPKKIKKVVAMGGAVYSHGNVSPVCEANIAGDPEAADIAVQADWDMVLVGLDVTLKTLLTMDDIKRTKRWCRPECKEILDFMEKELIYYQNGARIQNQNLENCPLHDPLAMIVAVDPSVAFTRKMVTRIECGGTYCRGKVVVDLREQPIEGQFVEHCLQVDSRKALNELFAAFQ